jgi:hypothetical protein
VGVVQHDHGVVALGQLHDLVQLGEVAVHGEDAVRHDQAEPLVLVQLQLLLQVLHVRVLVAVLVRAAEADAVDDGRVHQAVRDDDVVLAQDASKTPALASMHDGNSTVSSVRGTP